MNLFSDDDEAWKLEATYRSLESAMAEKALLSIRNNDPNAHLLVRETLKLRSSRSSQSDCSFVHRFLSAPRMRVDFAQDLEGWMDASHRFLSSLARPAARPEKQSEPPAAHLKAA